MSQTPNLNELRELNRRLTNLLADPHPGVPSWLMHLGEVLHAIAAFVGEGKSDADSD